jgi:2,3-bisphosphoglycerate-independent phosphoglycerate mutase
MNNKVILLILDGWGYSEKREGNAIACADTPNLNQLLNDFPHTLIGTSGHYVGLPEGQMGNSEVGHLNLGAGRVVYQEITRIDKSINDGDFFQNQVLLNLMQGIQGDPSLHIMGLVSNGGVHSSMVHLKALLKMAKDQQVKKVFLHAFTDGRDTPPHSGINYVREIEGFMSAEGAGEIATVSGRYYAMDRDRRWERTQKAYDALVKGEGLMFNSAESAIEASYNQGVTDEFILPSVILKNGVPETKIRKGDGVIFFNFRSDRGRQLTRALTDAKFVGFERQIIGVQMVTMTEYDAEFTTPIAFPPIIMKNLLGEIISRNSWKQLRIAETEKYPHVTFFFNGGEEKSYPGEDRLLIPSPKVATYDLQPEMSVFPVTDKVLEAIGKREYKLIVLNFANCDMVGHTGVFPAAKKAVEAVDTCVGKVFQAAMINGYTILLTADHGNAEQMLDEDGSPFTAHTTNPVHFIYIDPERKPILRGDGALCNVATTILEILSAEKTEEMESSMVVGFQ